MSDDLTTQHFQTLRQEILDVKARLNRLVVLGLIGAPLLTYFAVNHHEAGEINLTLLIAPMLMLILLVQYFAEQASMMRCGRYIYEKVEANGQGWEHWINEVRANTAEPPVFGLFVVVALGFVILTGSMAVTNILAVDQLNYSVFMYRTCIIAVPVVYGVSLLWVLMVLVRFWHSAFRTAG